MSPARFLLSKDDVVCGRCFESFVQLSRQTQSYVVSEYRAPGSSAYTSAIQYSGYPREINRRSKNARNCTEASNHVDQTITRALRPLGRSCIRSYLIKTVITGFKTSQSGDNIRQALLEKSSRHRRRPAFSGHFINKLQRLSHWSQNGVSLSGEMHKGRLRRPDWNLAGQRVSLEPPSPGMRPLQLMCVAP